MEAPGSSPRRTSSESSSSPFQFKRTSDQSRSTSSTTNISEVSKPALPRQITHLSNLIDPADLVEGWKVRSPSGNLLGPGEFINHPERPLSLRERQERVKAALQSPTQTLEHNEFGVRDRRATSWTPGSSKADMQGSITDTTEKKRKWWWLCCGSARASRTDRS